MNLKIEKAKKEDISEIVNIYLEFIKTHKNLKEFWLPDLKIKKLKRYNELLKLKKIKIWLYKTLLKEIKRKDEFHFVGKINKKVVGYINFCIKKNDDWYKIKKYGFIYDICILKKYRKKRIMKKLVKHAESELKKRKIDYILLNTIITNKIATLAWEKLNYKKEAYLHIKKI